VEADVSVTFSASCFDNLLTEEEEEEEEDSD